MMPYIRVVLIIIFGIGILTYVIGQLPNIFSSVGQVAAGQNFVNAKNLDYFKTFPKNVSAMYYGN